MIDRLRRRLRRLREPDFGWYLVAQEPDPNGSGMLLTWRRGRTVRITRAGAVPLTHD